jgi:gliding motility-associated-like protein
LGGVWSGLGVMGDWFDANITGLGNHLVIYQLENCYDTKLITVKDTLTPQVSVQPNLPARVLISQSKFFLNDNTQGAVSWNWDFGNGQTSNLQNSVVQYENSGKYIITLIITDSLGCTSYWISDTITIEYEELETSNVFTPNGDGINDWFLPKIEGYDLEVFRIYDRWGVPVFLSNAISQGWNGKNANGTDVPEGVYTYVLELVKPNGTKFIRTGVVTLLR